MISCACGTPIDEQSGATLLEIGTGSTEMTMDNGWNESADAWIARQGPAGDWGRRFVLDPALMNLIDSNEFTPALVLDAVKAECVGCCTIAEFGAPGSTRLNV